MRSTIKFEIELDEAGAHGREWLLEIKVGEQGMVTFTVRNAAGAVQAHGSERTAEFARVAQLVASAKR